MGRPADVRKERYHMLRRAGFNSHEATRYKELPFERIVKLCKAREIHQKAWKEELKALV